MLEEISSISRNLKEKFSQSVIKCIMASLLGYTVSLRPVVSWMSSESFLKNNKNFENRRIKGKGERQNNITYQKDYTPGMDYLAIAS